MRLRDRVEVYRDNDTRVMSVKAEVSYRKWDRFSEGGNLVVGVISIDELVCIIPAVLPESEIGAVVWRGKYYNRVGEVKVYRRNGKDHHYEIRLGQ